MLTLSEVMSNAVNTEEALQALLGDTYDSNTSYRISTRRNLARHLEAGWSDTGIVDGDLHLIAYKDA